jgi:splicing factor 3A subunit 1
MRRKPSEVNVFFVSSTTEANLLLKVAFAEIDWHDYAIVQTIEFTQADAQAELPAPMSLQQVESMTLAQKRVAAMIHETAADDVVAHRQRQAAEDEATAHAAAAAEAAIAAARADAATSYDMNEDDEAEKEAERARALGAGGSGQMKIRSDYVPKRRSHLVS